MTWERPGCVAEGEGEGFGLSVVGCSGGVEDVIRRCRSLISSNAVSVYRGADLTIFRATWRFILRGYFCQHVSRGAAKWAQVEYRMRSLPDEVYNGRFR